MSDELLRLRDIEGFLLDMDGTVYLSERMFDCSVPFMTYLKESGIKHLFMTNNSTNDREYYADKLTRLGWSESPENVLTSGEATARYISAIKPNARLFVCGTPVLTAEFERANFTLTDVAPDFAVIGFDTTLTYDKLWKLCDFVRLGVPYVATHPDFNCPVESATGFKPDVGAMIAFVEAATGKVPKVIGKPNREMIDCALSKLGTQRKTTAVVGDRLYTDIASGKSAGLLSILVLSGETKRSDLDGTPHIPDLVFEDLFELLEAMKRVRNK